MTSDNSSADLPKAKARVWTWVRSSVLAKRILLGIGVLFMLIGLILGGLRFTEMIPQSYMWIAILFLVLGTIGVLTVKFGLNKGRRWPLSILAILYIPWTINGLIGDIKQGYWALVSGEILGFVLVVYAIYILVRVQR